jgi:hypothetical protein
MGGIRKRKAEDQLSPYSKDEESHVIQEEMPKNEDVKIKKRAKASIGNRKGGLSNPESIKGLLSSVRVVNTSVVDDKLSGLNKSFIDAVQKVVSKQSNKDLTFLFKQYEKYLSKLVDKT